MVTSSRSGVRTQMDERQLGSILVFAVKANKIPSRWRQGSTTGLWSCASCQAPLNFITVARLITALLCHARHHKRRHKASTSSLPAFGVTTPSRCHSKLTPWTAPDRSYTVYVTFGTGHLAKQGLLSYYTFQFDNHTRFIFGPLY